MALGDSIFQKVLEYITDSLLVLRRKMWCLQLGVPVAQQMKQTTVTDYFPAQF